MTGINMKQSFIYLCFVLILGAVPAAAQLPSTCKPPASSMHPPAGVSPARVYDAIGVWFAQKGQPNCAVAAFMQAMRLEPHLAEPHFDLGLVRQSQKETAEAINEFRMALQYDPSLLQAHCAIGSSLTDPAEAESEFRKALDTDSQAVCALDGLAQLMVKQRRYDPAIQYWQQALQIQPDAPDLQLALGTAIYQSAKNKQANGQPASDGAGVADAIQLLTNLVKDHPDMTSAYFTLGNIYANERRDREAADEYLEVTRRNPNDMVALAARVKSLIDASAYSDALAPAREYVGRKPDDPLGHVMLGTVYQQLGDYAKAEPELELGAVKAPSEFEAQYQLGLVLARRGKAASALVHLRKAVAIRPADRAAQFQLVSVLRSLGQSQEAALLVTKLRDEQNRESLNSQLASEGTKANDLLQAGKASEAAQIYRHMLEEDPSNAQTAYNLALSLEAMQDMKGAEQVLRSAVDIEPPKAAISAELGRLQLLRGDGQSAKQSLESALKLDPELTEARGNLAMIYAKDGDLNSAEKLLRQTIEDDPKFKEGYLNLGLVLAQQNRKPEALKLLDEAVRLVPKDPVTLSTAGKAKLQMGMTAEGIVLLRNVVDLAPDLAAAHVDLALALASGYNLSAALDQAGEAVRLAPQSAVAHFYRGRILYDLGRSADAKKEFEVSSQLGPQMAEARYFLALMNKHDGDYAAAAKQFEETVRLQPNNTMAWYELGQSYDQESEKAKALAAWRKAIEIDPKFSQALIGLARALRETDRAESDKLMVRYATVQKERSILDRADSLANNGVEAATAHDWPEAIRQLQEAITACGECKARADLHRKLGIIYCQAGDLSNGEKELLVAKNLKPQDPVTLAALELVARARSQQSDSASPKAQ